MTRPSNHPVRSAEGTAELVETLARLAEFIAEEKLQDRWFQHLKDEPGSQLNEDCKFVAGLIHEQLPRIPILERRRPAGLSPSIAPAAPGL